MENVAPISSTAVDNGYSLENARAFGWNSVSGDLLPERVELLNKYVVGRTVLDAGCGGGGFVDHLAVYGRAGEACLRCSARLVGTHAIDGRMTVLCARCQS